MTQRVTLVSLDTNNKESPLNVDASGNLGVNLEGELAVGELKLAAADPGLVALLAGLVGPVGASSKNFTDLYTLATSGSGFKIGTLPNITIQNTSFGVSSLPDCTNAVLTAVKDQRTDYLATSPAVSALTTLQNAQTSTGTGEGAMTVTGFKMVAFTVVSTVVGTITYDFEVSVDGTNFTPATTGGALVTDHQGIDYIGSISQTGAGTWVYTMMCAGYTKVQCNISANGATAGTSVTVKAQAL